MRSWIKRRAPSEGGPRARPRHLSAGHRARLTAGTSFSFSSRCPGDLVTRAHKRRAEDQAQSHRRRAISISHRGEKSAVFSIETGEKHLEHDHANWILFSAEEPPYQMYWQTAGNHDLTRLASRFRDRGERRPRCGGCVQCSARRDHHPS